jgi:ribose 5-phosphate isomerase B
VKLCIGADHAGFELKETIRGHLTAQGLQVEDCGTSSPEPVDYPDIGAKVGREVSAGRSDRGILICGAGIGMAMVANKFPGVRAGVAPDVYSAKMSRAHNDANVLVLAARIVDAEAAKQIVDAWLSTEFEGGRHARRVQKISEIEENLRCQS